VEEKMNKETNWELEFYKSQLNALQQEYRWCAERMNTLQLLGREAEAKVKEIETKAKKDEGKKKD
jgi:hypothetical protein